MKHSGFMYVSKHFSNYFDLLIIVLKNSVIPSALQALYLTPLVHDVSCNVYLEKSI